MLENIVYIFYNYFLYLCFVILILKKSLINNIMLKRSSKKSSVDKSPLIDTNTTSQEEEVYEHSTRPKFLKEFIGQERLKNNLAIFLEATRKRDACMEHMLFYGPPGLGKTTLANIIARELGANFRITSGPAIEKQGDLAAIISSLKKGDILFIDEIHRLRPQIEEMLYSAMEDFALDIMIGSGPGARSMRIALPEFTLIGATTRVASLSSPLRDRFGHVLKIDFYTHKELEHIIQRSAHILQCNIEKEATQEIAHRCRYTPRIANRLLKRVRDFADVLGDGNISYNITLHTLKELGIDNKGLDTLDRNILQSIQQQFHGGPVGLATLAATLGEEETTIENVCEPFLLQLGFLRRLPRGRSITAQGLQHLTETQKNK